MALLIDPPVPVNPVTDYPVALRGEGAGAETVRVIGMADKAWVTAEIAAAFAGLATAIEDILGV